MIQRFFFPPQDLISSSHILGSGSLEHWTNIFLGVSEKIHHTRMEIFRELELTAIVCIMTASVKEE